MGIIFSSNALAGYADGGIPTTSYAYAQGNQAFLGADVTYSFDGPEFAGPVGQVTPFIIQPDAAAPTLTCSPITVYASDQSLECPIAGTSLTGGLYTLSFLQYTSSIVTDSNGDPVTDANGNTVYTLSPTTVPATDTAGNTITDRTGNVVYTTQPDPDNTLTAPGDGYTYSFIAPLAAATLTSTITPILTGYATVTSGVSSVLPTSTVDVPAQQVTVTVYATTVISHQTTKTTLTGLSTIITKTAACPKPTTTLLKCNQDNCYRAMSNRMESASSFCAGYTTTTGAPTPSYLTQCSDLTSRVSSACTCLFSSSTPKVTARGVNQIVYAAPDFTYSDSIAAVTIVSTAGPTTIITSDIPSATVTDPNETVSSGNSTSTSDLSNTVTVTVFTSVIDHRSASTITVSPTTC